MGFEKNLDLYSRYVKYIAVFKDIHETQSP